MIRYTHPELLLGTALRAGASLLQNSPDGRQINRWRYFRVADVRGVGL
jgi:hypothetical protein